MCIDYSTMIFLQIVLSVMTKKVLCGNFLVGALNLAIAHIETNTLILGDEELATYCLLGVNSFLNAPLFHNVTIFFNGILCSFISSSSKCFLLLKQ